MEQIIFASELTRRLLFNIEDYVRYVHLIFANNTKITVFKNFLQLNLNYPNNCARLNLRNVSSLRGLRRLKVKFEEVPDPDLKVEIRLEDGEKTTERSNSFSRFSYSGPSIMLSSLNRSSIRLAIAETKHTYWHRNTFQVLCCVPGAT